MFYTDTIKDLENKTNIQEIQKGEYRTTEPCICESAAGFYIGTWCIKKNG